MVANPAWNNPWQVLASQLYFLANRNAGLAIPPLFWPVNCIIIGGHIALLSGPTACLFPILCLKLTRLKYTTSHESQEFQVEFLLVDMLHDSPSLLLRFKKILYTSRLKISTIEDLHFHEVYCDKISGSNLFSAVLHAIITYHSAAKFTLD